MEITKQENIVPEKFYWLTYLGEERIGQSMNFYGEIRFRVTGFDDYVDFDSVSNIWAVCLFKH
jgi:hypothetical protein